MTGAGATIPGFRFRSYFDVVLLDSLVTVICLFCHIVQTVYKLVMQSSLLEWDGHDSKLLFMALYYYNRVQNEVTVAIARRKSYPIHKEQTNSPMSSKPTRHNLIRLPTPKEPKQNIKHSRNQPDDKNPSERSTGYEPLTQYRKSLPTAPNQVK